jgi:uncharacterized protein
VTGSSTRLRVRVSPGAGDTAIIGRHGDAWKVRVKEAPERGRANDAVLRLLADTLALQRDEVSIVSGHAAREKMISLNGVTAAEVDRRLTAVATSQTTEQR